MVCLLFMISSKGYFKCTIPDSTEDCTYHSVREETHTCHYMGIFFRLASRVLLYASSHRQARTYHNLCYTSCRALAGTREISQWVHHEGSIRQSITPQADTLPWNYILLLYFNNSTIDTNQIYKCIMRTM